jgi:hypothetical protein
MPQEKSTKIYVDNSSVIALIKNPVFHDRSKYFDTRFHYLRDFITNKEVEVKYVKTQYQVRIFSQSHSNMMFLPRLEICWEL